MMFTLSRLINNILNEEFEKAKNQTILKDINKISLDYIPESLPHREEELSQLIYLFKDIINSFKSPEFECITVTISGDKKSGKTVTTKRFGLDLVKYVNSKNYDSNVKLIYRHINCIRYRTIYSIFISVIQSFVPEFPIRGFSTFELIKYLKEYLEISNTYLLLTLDDVNVIDEDKDYDSILLSLMTNEENHFGLYKKRTSIILISNKIESLEKFHTSNSIQYKQNNIVFSHYTGDQLRDILQQRASETLQEGSWSKQDLSKIVDLVDVKTNGLSDPRMGLEILWRTAKISEQKNLNKLNVDILNLSQEFPFDNSKIELNLKIQEKVILFIIAQILLKHPFQNFTRIKEIKKEFDHLKTNLDIPFNSLGHTSIFNYLNNLKKLNLIITQVGNAQKRGRSTIIKLNMLPSHVVILLRNQLLKNP